MRSRARLVAVAFTLGVLSALGGCPAEPVLIETLDGGDGDSGDIDGGELGAISCVDVADGLACAPERHCIDGRCLFNTCGDGVAAGNEQCDDGNQALADECSPSCRNLPTVCGDSRVSAGEQCDDGNRNDTDACNNLCLTNVEPDAGVLDPLTADCPVLTSIVSTPYSGSDTRLVGNYFSVDAVFAVAPAYLMWSAEGGQVFTQRKEPFRAGFQCGVTGPQVISLFTAHPSCIAISHQVTVACTNVRSM